MLCPVQTNLGGCQRIYIRDDGQQSYLIINGLPETAEWHTTLERDGLEDVKNGFRSTWAQNKEYHSNIVCRGATRTFPGQGKFLGIKVFR